MKAKKTGDKIDELLNRGVDKVYPSKEALEKILRSGKKLKLYQGFDPTGAKLHIGHMVGLRKLAEWQALGHHVIFLIGDATGMIGDPSGKTEARKMLTREVVLKNAENYKIQAGRILRFKGENPAEIKYNSEWLDSLSGLEFLQIAGHLSFQQVIKRDLFQERTKQGQDVFMNEFLYPVMQAYDSVAMDVDLEIGGSDQMFNMLMGRKLMRHMLGKEKFVMTLQLLTDSQGKKIGKTEGNAIALDDRPENLFGKIMAFPDEVLTRCFECLTNMPIDEIKKKDAMTNKKRLAFEIVKDLNNESAARQAQENWENTFQKRQIPGETEEIKGTGGLGATLVSEKIVASMSEWRRLVEEGAVKKLTEKGEERIINFKIEASSGVYKIGKHRFIKIK
ncbi:TPA: tyrosine--tRNA ligase [Candidatus Nomurabacteria bacterium]|uniref:Tyrosine--tRNA ligase n=2 Tax=Candidatus Nomuraibacteriota TaxID=1752729 RepID=A0A1F6YPV3_9BACT|nr:MAG: tyrosyl-tRNA synthetase, tyrosyl-tRNA synthetase [Parcubacteria group bacterium GW2011_GWC1_42_21]KKS58413.1 MAG: Tyrosine-tRNA ligase [Candidatus Nomurabacteria bacterium GW2011_GWF1_42_40]KKT00315.1 MAG: Tyrosine-tRNA ligase [Candidatus Nomurabacteria bacterium GW2011_GWA1_43_17]KKT08119.1 MAG: Tyrosine-tRNA ligase [Candidatus Nomurabacteria bacterium GW2011_GWB1_43_19]KKT11504.1 MAG: Tyrosine-tRNA ligase [Candidatus Nomurabacteria bacterium GW2011_GWF2_43_24]KKT18185.1 MAG: Tyrosine